MNKPIISVYAKVGDILLEIPSAHSVSILFCVLRHVESPIEAGIMVHDEIAVLGNL